MTLTAHSLGCQRGDRLILSDIDLTLRPGDCVILRGPNGVGKTTLLRVLAGLSAPESGTLKVDPDQIAYAGHLDAVKSQLSVAENLTFWSGVYGSERIAETSALFGLDQMSDRLAYALSAGQKRRLGLARLHLTGRKIWLLDEPMVSLDSAHIALFESVFADHCAKGGMAMISTHINLDIPNARTLDLGQFTAKLGSFTSPFLEPFS